MLFERYVVTITVTVFLTTAFLFLMTFYGFKYLPFKIVYVKAKQHPQNQILATDSKETPITNKRGWMKLSFTPLSGQKLSWNLDVLDQPSLVSASLRIVSQSTDIVRRVFSMNTHLIAPVINEQPVVCFAILEDGVLTLHSSKKRDEIIEIIPLNGATVK